jgi:RND family efflux transporter MFP subunit
MAAKRNILVSVATQAGVSLVLLSLASGIFVALASSRPQPEKSHAPAELRRVEVMEARPVPVRRQWQGFGTANARDEADVPAEVLAVVIEVPPGIIEGAAVKQGELLARLDDSDFELQRKMASQRIAEIQSQLDQLELEEESWRRRVELVSEEVRLAEADFERVQQALQQQAARQRELDQSREKLVATIRAEVATREQFDRIPPRRAQLQAQRLEQESALRMSERNVSRCEVRSPLEGFLADVDIEAGESVAPGQRVARVVNVAQLDIPLRLPASARPTVAVGDEAILESQGATVQTWHGQVRRIGPSDDQNTRTMTVYVEIEQDPRVPGWLAPGRFVEGTVISQHAELRTVVPRRSLLGDRLLVVEDGRVRSRTVNVDFHVQGDFGELGVSAEQWAVLAAPLAQGAKVVVNATRTLPEGLRVEPVPAVNGAMGAASTRAAS